MIVGNRGGGYTPPSPRAPVLSEKADPNTLRVMRVVAKGGNPYSEPAPPQTLRMMKAQAAKPVNHVAYVQRFLANKGYYHGSIDGIAGPMTKAAIAAWHNRGSGSTRAQSYSGGGGSRGGGGGSRGGGGGRGGRGRGGSASSYGGMKAVNPAAYAKSLVNSQYNPLIQQLQYQRDQATSQGAQNLADIGSYFGQLMGTISQQQTSSDQYSAQALGQQAADQQALLASLGGGANQGSGNAANFATLMHGVLAGQTTAQHNFLANQATLAGQSKAQSLTDQQRLTQEAVQKVNDQINTENAAKSAAYVSALGNAQQLRLQQLAAIQNMRIAGGQFNLSQAQGRAQLTNEQLQNRALAKQLSNNGNLTPFRSLTASDRSKLVAGVNNTMYVKGTSTLRPSDAWVKAANMLRAIGYDVQNNVRVRNWLSQSWLNYVKDYNSTHPKTPYKPNSNGTPFSNQQWRG